ncbi:MAG: GGDEF domain-containing protein [Candidatus Eremiobacteraeota bacterium]|nr:GGDEF domain-containing protein [Candidatus Eremiobacteraeota bacterium]
MLSRAEGDVMAICEMVGAEYGGEGGGPTETLSKMARTEGKAATCEDIAKLTASGEFATNLRVPVGSFITMSFRVLENSYAVTFYSRFPRPVPFDAGDHEVMGMLADYFSNFLEGQRKMEQMTHLAYNDQLTGLPNRAVFFSRAEEVISMATRYKRECLMLYLDLDGFKLINDTQGHDAGDAALVEVAHRLRDILRREDFVARIGGDEFALLIPEVQNPGNPYEVIDRIRKIMLEPFEISGNRFFLSTSIGVAMFPRDGTTHTELLAVADKSMYQDKRASPPDRRMTPKRRRTDLSVVI